MVTQKAKEKLFRLTPDDDARVNFLIQYAHQSGHIAKPSLQDFMVFSIQCADAVLQDHHGDSGDARPRRTVV